jgi:CHAT domain-containing protein
VRGSRPSPPRATLLAFGGPDFDGKPGESPAEESRSARLGPSRSGGPYRGATSDCHAFRTRRFGALPGAVDEVEEIGALWTAVRDQADEVPADASALVLTGSTAREGTLKRVAPQYSTLHLATHGFFLQGSCLGAADADAPADSRPTGQTLISIPRLAENPLRLSGLALAGANRRDAAGEDEENGILTAEEIATLDLSGVSWVVLSACETGAGQIVNGEGVLGLRRAFEVAGARTSS